jgi:hypothetical protein
MVALQSYAGFKQMMDNALPIQEAIQLVAQFIVEKSQDLHNAEQEVWDSPSHAARYFICEDMVEEMAGWCDKFNLDKQSDTARAIKSLALMMSLSQEYDNYGAGEEDPKAWVWLYSSTKLYEEVEKGLPELWDYVG